MLEAFLDYRTELFQKADDPSDPMTLQEAHSKADFPAFLHGPIATSLYKGFTRVAPQYRRYGKIQDVKDFRPTRIHGLNGISGIGYVGDQGEYNEMVRSERAPASLMIDTYGGVYSVTRQAVINDNSGALLKDNPDEMGYAAAQFITEAIIAYIESNPTAPDGNPLFHAGSHNNAATAALSEDSLADAISAMEGGVDEDGRPNVVRPRTLAVKNVRLELIANRIINSQETGGRQNINAAAGAGSNIFDKGTDNPLQGMLPSDAVVRDPYWSDANDWYLFADPNDVPAFAIGFLNGKEEPSVFLKNPEAKAATGGGSDPYTWEVDSVDFKVRFDFGTGVVDPRGAYRSIVT